MSGGHIDFAGINAAAFSRLPDLLAAWLPSGRIDGVEYATRYRPEDKEPSFKVNMESGVWSDFGSGDAGSDPVSLFAFLNGLSQGEAAKQLADQWGCKPNGNGNSSRPALKKKPEWIPVCPVPADAPPPNFHHYKHGAPSMTWEYMDAVGLTIGHVCRFDKPDGGKEILPYSYCRGPNGEYMWRFKAFTAPRPLYGLDRLHNLPEAPMLMVEGEKACDAAQALCGDSMVVVTWPGGCNAVGKANFSPLNGRRVCLWPDNDEPGFKAVLKIAEALDKAGAEVAGFVVPDAEWSKGADVADFPKWDRDKLFAEIKKRKVDRDRLQTEAKVRYGIEPQAQAETDSEELPETNDEVSGTLLPSPPPFPLEIFPQDIQAAILTASEAFSVPPAVPATTFLAAVGACIGMTRGLVAKRGWIAYPNCFWALVAKSGMGKSPCSSAILKPIHERERWAYEEYRTALGVHEIEMKGWSADFTKAKNKGLPLPEKPSLPAWEQIYIEDSTSQAVGKVLADNPRGILWYRDELSGLLSDLGRYDSKGNDMGDKARLLSAYDCGPWKVSRSSKEGLHIPHACVSVFGTVQPGLLPHLFQDLDAVSGFLPRFIFIRCEQERPPLWTDVEFHEEAARPLTEFLEYCLALQFDDQGKSVLVGVSGHAKTEVHKWYDRQVLEQWNMPELEKYEALAPKLRAQVFKLCLPLHVLDCWLEGRSETDAVSLDTMRRTLMLAEWIKAHQRQVWDLLGMSGEVTEASPIEKRVAVAIVELSGQIEGGKLPTRLIVEHLNQGVASEFHVKADHVGKAYKKLGLCAVRTRKERCVSVSAACVEELKKKHVPEKGVTPVTPVTSQGRTTVFTGDILENHPSHPSPGQEGGMTPVTPEKKVSPPQNPHESKAGDACDTCDGFQGNTLDSDDMWASPAEVEL